MTGQAILEVLGGSESHHSSEYPVIQLLPCLGLLIHLSLQWYRQDPVGQGHLLVLLSLGYNENQGVLFYSFHLANKCN